MSSAATVGPPSHPLGGGPAGNNFNTRNIGNGARFDSSNGTTRPKRVYPHIDDLLAARPDINVHSPVRRVLQEAEILIKNAGTHLDFGRPDLALQEYIKAYVTTVEIIPKHKDYPSLQADRGLHQTFHQLTQRIRSQQDTFERVKEMIKRDNAENGTRSNRHADELPPKSHVQQISMQGPRANGNAIPPSHQQSKSVTIMNDPAPMARGAPIRRKPVVQPKPAGFHSKSLSSPVNRLPAYQPESQDTDLASRFAKLRSTGSPPTASTAPVQDPRIRTQPIAMPEATNFLPRQASSPRPPSPNSAIPRSLRPGGPRDMPSVPSVPPKIRKLPLDVNVPIMPRAPDAIYSPARNLNTPAGIDPPRSTPRSMYSLNGRSGSVSSLVESSSSTMHDRNQNPYFPAIPKSLTAEVSQTRFGSNIPDSAQITAEELVSYLGKGSHEVRILIVDLRSREDFDSGHIMAQSIICIEPVCLHSGMSAEEIAERLIISPEGEQKLFEQRHEFDLVVYYDENSTSFSAHQSFNRADTAILDHFSKAVYEYSYDKKTKRRPALLQGGLSAWIDLVGEQSLQITNTASASTVRPIKIGPRPGRQIQRVPMARGRLTPRSYNTRLLSDAEERAWEDQLLKNEQPPGPIVSKEGSWDEAAFIKTQEDFLRRFPEAPTVKESMSFPPKSYAPIDPYWNSSTTQHNRPQAGPYRTFDEMNAAVPRMPQRPPPARARTATSGVTDGESQSVAPFDYASIGQPKNPSGLTGLQNMGNTCYMNSVIQCLNGTEDLTRYFLSGQWSQLDLPIKDSEKSAPPQLMVKNFAFLLRHFYAEKFAYLRPTTFAVSSNHSGRNL
jgi:ubiquitin carboxyl-terminal hydrolase 8